MSEDSGRFMMRGLCRRWSRSERQFDLNSYKKFFEDKGYTGAEYYVVDGRMPRAIAVITKR